MLRPSEGRFQQAAIAETRQTPMLLNLLFVDRDCNFDWEPLRLLTHFDSSLSASRYSRMPSSAISICR
jgi:hypothetical protein